MRQVARDMLKAGRGEQVPLPCRPLTRCTHWRPSVVRLKAPCLTGHTAHDTVVDPPWSWFDCTSHRGGLIWF